LLQAELEAFGPKITWAAIYGSIARGEERAQSDVDLLIHKASKKELDELRAVSARDVEDCTRIEK
jgi:predicted nucleotidyltransferase